MSAKILVVDDERAIREILSVSLEDEGFEVRTAENGSDGLRQISEFRPQIVLLDIWMPGDLDGIDTLKLIKSEFPGVHVIMMSGHGTIETAVTATKLGAWDFVEKPLSIDRVVILLNNILSLEEEKADKMSLLNKLRTHLAMVGESEEMRHLKQLIARVAPTNSWGLITGENGVGKELVAQNIHYLSPRASKPFVDVNCAAIPDELVEAELFGYEKGAFTGATKMKVGRFDQANGGTLFLDEIADMSMDAQAKILRVLQEQSFQRVGGTETIKVDVRVLAATNKDLKAEIEAGRFREDLFYRLNVIPLKVPRLADRPSDIPSLVNHFGDHFAKESGQVRKVFTDEAMDLLAKYKWPGNVRELKNFLERVYILTPTDSIEAADIRFAGLSAKEDNSEEYHVENFREARDRFERAYLEKKISENNGNITKTAENIGLERSYLHRKIKSYGIEVSGGSSNES